jgi:hypothetical protein
MVELQGSFEEIRYFLLVRQLADNQPGYPVDRTFRKLRAYFCGVRGLLCLRSRWRTESVVCDSIFGEIIITINRPGPGHPTFDLGLDQHGPQNQVASHAVPPHGDPLRVDDVHHLQALERGDGIDCIRL